MQRVGTKYTSDTFRGKLNLSILWADQFREKAWDEAIQKDSDAEKPISEGVSIL